MSQRLRELRGWLASVLQVPAVSLEPVSEDASFRRYFRSGVRGRSYIVMDAPPAREDCRPFVRVASLLRDAGVHAPEVFAHDLTRGFLLLSDLGRQTYRHALRSDNADSLFADAIAALIRWQLASRPAVLPPYDRALLQRELKLFPDWYVAHHLNVTLTATERDLLESSFSLLEDSALGQPQVYVHRDYMPRNLMVCTPNPGVLDFQDAVYGPITYDAASLFQDAFISWEIEQVSAWRRAYWQQARRAGLPVQELAEFERASDWMGMQRHLKVLGIFARIFYRDGKSGYLEDTPRFLNYLRETGRHYQEFTPLLRVLDGLEQRGRRLAGVP